MQKRLLSALFWILLLNIIVKPLWLFGIEVGVQNVVGNATYGMYIAIFNISYIFNILLDIGITNFNTRNIAQHPQLIRKHLSNILVLRLLLLALYLVITFTVGLTIGYCATEFRMLLWLCINQFLSALVLYLRSNFEGLMLFKWDSVLSVIDRVLMIVICGVLLMRGSMADEDAIFYFIYAQTVAYLITVVLALVVLVRKGALRGLHYSRAFSLSILRQSLPFALLVLLMASYNRLDPILLQRLCSNTSAGIYAGAFRLLDALTMIAYLVSIPLLPIFSVQCKQRKGIADTIGIIFPLLMVYALGCATTLSAMATPLMEVLYNSNISDYAAVFRILVWCIVPISLTYLFGTLLTANGSLRTLNIMAALSLLINVGINILLIPKIGAVGSACASLVAQTFMAFAQWIKAQRLFLIPPQEYHFPHLALYILAIVCVNIILYQLSLPWLWWLVATVVIALLLAMLLHLIDIKKIKQIIITQ